MQQCHGHADCQAQPEEGDSVPGKGFFRGLGQEQGCPPQLKPSYTVRCPAGREPRRQLALSTGTLTDIHLAPSCTRWDRPLTPLQAAPPLLSCCDGHKHLFWVPAAWLPFRRQHGGVERALSLCDPNKLLSSSESVSLSVNCFVVCKDQIHIKDPSHA